MKCTRPEIKDYHKGGQLLPCGYCYACKSNQKQAWKFRLTEELKVSPNAWFITLTYDQENIPILDPATGELLRGIEHLTEDTYRTLDYADLDNFIKAVKNRVYREHKEIMQMSISPAEVILRPKMKYYAVGEYGGANGRPHYHIIFFDLWEHIANGFEKAKYKPKDGRKVDKTCMAIENIWNKGKCDTEPVNGKLINYITGYVFEKSKYTKDMQVRPAMRCSKHLGANYLKNNTQYHKGKLNPWVTFNGKRMAMPKYYRDRIFTEAEKEIINEKLINTYVEQKDLKVDHLRKDSKIPRMTEGRAQNEYSMKIREQKRRKL